MIKQVIAYDDDALLRNELEKMFRPLRTYFNLVSTFPNAIEVLEHIKTFKPDIILLDIDMSGNDDDGLIALHKIKKYNSEQKVMMLTTFDNDDKVFNAMCLGADGYMLKTDFVHQVAHEFMLRSLRIIFSDGAYLTPSIAKKIILAFRDKNIADRIQAVIERFNMLFIKSKNIIKNDMYTLKPIHVEILEAIAEGKTSPQIAQDKDIPENTINHYIKEIFKALEVHTRARAIKKALEERIIKLKS